RTTSTGADPPRGRDLSPGRGPHASELHAHACVEEPARQVVGRRVIAVERTAQADRRVFAGEVVHAQAEAQAAHQGVAVPGRLQVVVGRGIQDVEVRGAVVAD